MPTATFFFDTLNDLKEFVLHNSFTQYTIDGGNKMVAVKNVSQDSSYKCMDKVKEIVFKTDTENGELAISL